MNRSRRQFGNRSAFKLGAEGRVLDGGPHPTEKGTLEGAVCPGTTISSCCGVRPPLSTTVRSHAGALTQQRCDLLPNDSGRFVEY